MASRCHDVVSPKSLPLLHVLYIKKRNQNKLFGKYSLCIIHYALFIMLRVETASKNATIFFLAYSYSDWDKNPNSALHRSHLARQRRSVFSELKIKLDAESK